MKTNHFTSNRISILFSLTVLIFLPFVSNAQLYVTTGNKVGVGNSLPAASLHVGTAPLVYSDVSTIGLFGGSVGSGGSAYPLTLSNTATVAVANKALMTFSFGTGWSATGFMGASIENTGNAYTGLVFGTYGAGGLQENMRIQAGGNVGIGTTNPASQLEVYKNASGALEITANNPYTSASSSAGFTAKNNSKSMSMYMSGTGGLGTALYATDAGILTSDGTSGISLFPTSSSSTATLRFGTNGNESARFDINGNFAIGMTNPTYKLQVNGQPAANGYTQFANYSDSRLKTNVITIDSSLTKIMKLRPVQFNFNNTYMTIYKDSNNLTRIQKGFIAQEVKAIFPEMVGTGNIKGIEYFDLNLSNLQVYLVKAMQEQQKMITGQDSSIKAQKILIDNLQTKITICCNRPQGANVINTVNNPIGTINQTGLGTGNNITGTNGSSLNATGAELLQNIPNPFSQQTSIQYLVPTTAQSASILVFDMQGKLIKTAPVINYGSGAVTINGSELSAGMFMYSLIVDGNIIDTKRMILTQ